VTTPRVSRVSPDENRAAKELEIPRVPWETIRAELDESWVPLQAPHHSIVAMNGGGKSYFAMHGLMSMLPYDKVVIIDVKGDDPTLKGFGKPVNELPHKVLIELTRRKRVRKPGENHYRLLVNPNREAARKQVKSVLERVWDEGKWFVFIDETRYLTDPRDPSLGVRSFVEQLWMRGRSREISIVAMTQAPRWVPSSFYDQPSYVWIGRVNDEEAQKRLREIGGLSKVHLPVIASLKKREFLLIAEGGDRLAITGITG
jgi:hypothetical protein